jgi:glycosyltransferase involved in cell wall biosynthesis
MNPLISVIIPVYKKEQYITKCIESVLFQTFTDFELLLIDDGSPDKSGQICDEYSLKDSRIKVFHKSNGGVGNARNYGMDKAQGQYFAFLDADDEWMCEHLMNVSQTIKQFPDCGLYACARISRFPDGSEKTIRFDKQTTTTFLLNDLLRNIAASKVITSGITISATAYKTTGGFREVVTRGEDSDLWLRIACKYPVAYHNEPSFYYHIATGNNSTETALKAGFPYWEWYGYPYHNRIFLFVFTSRILISYMKAAGRLKNISLYFYYFRKIKWGSYFLNLFQYTIFRLKEMYLS